MSTAIRRPLAVLAVSVLLLALAAGTALAVERYCSGYGANCYGTRTSDTLYDGPGRDNIYARGGADYIYAFWYYDDSDYVYGQGGRDYIDAYDYDTGRRYDRVDGGRGYDVCYGEYVDTFKGCEEVYQF